MSGPVPTVPFVPEPLFYLALLVFALVGLWVYRDATERGSEWAWQWGMGTFILLTAGVLPGIAALGVYLTKRRDTQATG